MFKKTVGYKAFNSDMTNRYGCKFEEGKVYSISDGELVFGNNGNGFHFCTNLEDVLRYFPAMDNDICIAKVIGIGDVVEFCDDYYGYYDMFVTRSIYIEKVLDRKEIIEVFLKNNSFRVIRFLQSFKLSEEELLLFKFAYKNNISVCKAIRYYQENDKTAYDIPKVKKYC